MGELLLHMVINLLDFWAEGRAHCRRMERRGMRMSRSYAETRLIRAQQRIQMRMRDIRQEKGVDRQAGLLCREQKLHWQ